MDDPRPLTTNNENELSNSQITGLLFYSLIFVLPLFSLWSLCQHSCIIRLWLVTKFVRFNSPQTETHQNMLLSSVDWVETTLYIQYNHFSVLTLSLKKEETLGVSFCLVCYIYWLTQYHLKKVSLLTAANWLNSTQFNSHWKPLKLWMINCRTPEHNTKQRFKRDKWGLE